MKRKHILILVPIVILVLLSTLCITKINKSLTPTDKESISGYIYYLIHKKSIDRKVQQVFCEELEEGMDFELVKEIISENYDVEYHEIKREEYDYSPKEYWGFDLTLMLNESNQDKNFILFGKNLYLKFLEGKYLYAHYNSSFDHSEYLCSP